MLIGIACVEALAAASGLDAAARARVGARAEALVRRVRAVARPSMMEAFLAEYGLSTREGVALMCLAEAMLRVPDAATMDDLICDKIAPHDWGAHLGDSGSILVNASTWALMLTGRVLEAEAEPGVAASLRGAVRRLGEPVIRTAVMQAMRRLGGQFVLAEDIDGALARAARLEARGYRYAYDMLGEAARTEADAARHFANYRRAIARLAERADPARLHDNPGISIKLSALHPRVETAKRASTLPVLVERTATLAAAAAAAGITFNIDAEEMDRLELTLDVAEAVLRAPRLAGWEGFGLVVQAYGPRARAVVDWLDALARALDRRLTVRLVKGAYWDAEIKRAQVLGLEGFAVFTRKAHTDVAYLACARALLDRRPRLYPQFATHNAHTAAAVLELAGNDRSGFEFQRLHGMGEALHELLLAEEGLPSRIYAPVGAHADLLAYLVRRLLENGANSSFVHQLLAADVPPAAIAKDPIDEALASGARPHPKISPPPALYGPARANARGFDHGDPATLEAIAAARAPFEAPYRWRAAPLVAGAADAVGVARPVVNPAALVEVVGEVVEATPELVARAVDVARAAEAAWAARAAGERAACLARAADLYEAHTHELVTLCAREAGKTLTDAVAELREAVDFLRYYAAGAEAAAAASAPCGTIACISPWNFPLAIFTGQIAAALVTGNAVVAKPAEETPLIARRAVELLHEAGVPAAVLAFLPGDGERVGAALTADPRLAGVAFTGSLAVAKAIDRQLAATAPSALLVAETGGVNAMIADSTALPEQAVRDILESAFKSAGQRCSALRVLYVQADVEARLVEMLTGAMETLALGDPLAFATDVGPVIAAEARARIQRYVDAARAAGRLIKQLAAPAGGHFVGPALVRVGGIDDVPEEVFGPVLHVATFRAAELDAVVERINAQGYGLTFAMHSRIDGRVQRVLERVRAGNLYVNRNQIGAVVGVQPFGGEGLSGTGPKAGGPHYLARFRREPGAADAAAPTPTVAADRLEAALAELTRSPLPAEPVATLRAALAGRAAAALD
ncbi:MAG: bifunctional proline dehydrogenase/L-glutamate gamma-semialdehyde dehydrogenase PutA, partial [Alphaproteobacteria bacterium]